MTTDGQELAALPLTAPGADETMVAIGALLDAVRAIGAGAGLVLVRSTEGSGLMFVDAGHICWAAVPQTKRFLVDRLAAAGLDREALDEALARSRTSGRPLGAVLVERGDVSPDVLAQVLHEHSLESMAHQIATTISAVEVLPRTPGAFASPLSFPAVPFFADLAERLLEIPRPLYPPSAIADLADLTAFGVLATDDVAIPVRMVGQRVPSVAEALELATTGRAIMTHVGGGTASFRERRRAWSVAGTPDFFMVAEGTTAASFAWMVSKQVPALSWPDTDVVDEGEIA
ncbi:MAG: hypothetical protein K8W52_03240 [Deltaproteobacteria bacterium]|nr:hypothetical protein [Deltaproteobacteria bacterium]